MEGDDDLRQLIKFIEPRNTRCVAPADIPVPSSSVDEDEAEHPSQTPAQAGGQASRPGAGPYVRMETEPVHDATASA